MPEIPARHAEPAGRPVAREPRLAGDPRAAKHIVNPGIARERTERIELTVHISPRLEYDMGLAGGLYVDGRRLDALALTSLMLSMSPDSNERTVPQ